MMRNAEMRLIDADALKKTLEKLWNVHDDQDFANKDVWREIENAPTIEYERTVKPKKGAYDLIRCDCGMPVSSNYDYCPKCKAKLDWSE